MDNHLPEMLLHMDYIKRVEKAHLRSCGEWLPEERVRYHSERRAKDLRMIAKHWSVPAEYTDNKVHIDDVPTKIQKKYNKLVRVHEYGWATMDDEIIHSFENITDKAQREGYVIATITKLLQGIRKVLPTYKSKIIVDVPRDFRRSICGSEVFIKKDTRFLQYWNSYRRANIMAVTAQSQADLRAALHEVHETLSLLPPLQYGEMPHKMEVMMRTYCPKLLDNLGDIEGALMECRICMAAVRLLAYHGKVDITDPNDNLIRKCTTLSGRIILLATRIKIRNGLQRPLFSKIEYLALQKEIGFGLYSTSNYKCNFCGKTEPEVKLSICSACSKVWYCSMKCSKAGRKAHKVSCSEGTMIKEYVMKDNLLLSRLDNGSEDVVVFSPCFSKDYLLAMCLDEATGEYFDALTNASFAKVQGDTPILLRKSKLQQLLEKPSINN